MANEKNFGIGVVGQAYQQIEKVIVRRIEYERFDPWTIIDCTPVTVSDQEKYCSEVRHKGVLAQFSVFSLPNRPFTYFLTLHNEENSEAMQEVFNAFQDILGNNAEELKIPQHLLKNLPKEEIGQIFKWVSIKAD